VGERRGEAGRGMGVEVGVEELMRDGMKKLARQLSPLIVISLCQTGRGVIDGRCVFGLADQRGGKEIRKGICRMSE
jgi:hypothetical protein